MVCSRIIFLEVLRKLQLHIYAVSDDDTSRVDLRAALTLNTPPRHQRTFSDSHAGFNVSAQVDLLTSMGARVYFNHTE